MAIMKRTDLLRVDVDVEKLELLFFACVSVKQCAHFEKVPWFLEKLNILTYNMT